MEESTAQEFPSNNEGERKPSISELGNSSSVDDRALEVVSSDSGSSSPNKQMTTTNDDQDDDVLVLSPPPPSRPTSSDGTVQSSRNDDGDDDCVVEWTNATSMLVDFSHGRPDCGVHKFSNAANRIHYCDKCYCVVCDEYARLCPQWEKHCEATKTISRPDSEEHSNDRNVIDIEDATPNTAIHPDLQRNASLRSLHARRQAMAELMFNNSRSEDRTPPTAPRRRALQPPNAGMGLLASGYDHWSDQYTKEFNDAYNRAGGPKERGRNPKDMRITEVLAEKLQEALKLSEGATSTTASDSSDPSYASKKEQLKKRYAEARVEGDIEQLGLHKSFFVEGVRLGWPYPAILMPQRQMAIHLIKALKSSRHVVLESPTGTGKSAAILCAVLAWQRHHAKSLRATSNNEEEQQEKFPRIIYCSRTHTQVAQMVASLKKTSYRPRMTVLGSREQYCIHKHIKDRRPSNPAEGEKDRPRINVNTACQIRVANTEKIRKSLYRSHDYYYDDNKPPPSLPGDGNGNIGGSQESADDEENEEDKYESSNWILKNSTRKLTCPHYRQLTSARAAQLVRSKFLVKQETINCCKSGGSETAHGVHDVEELVNFGINPYLEENLVLYRRSKEESFGFDVDKDCRIRAIRADSPAKFNGQMKPGDKILAVNRNRVPNFSLLQREIQKTNTEKLHLRILRSTSPGVSMSLDQTDHETNRMNSAKSTTEHIEVVLNRPDNQTGFGMTLQGVDAETTGCSINSVRAGSPADGHVKEGDIVEAINGEVVAHLGFADVVEKIKSTPGPLRLTLRRRQVAPADSDDDMTESDYTDEDAYSPHSCCPYYISKALSKYSDITFCPYNYVLDPGIRSALEISLENTVVVLDEGHNVEGTLTESGSGQFGEFELCTLISTLFRYSSSSRRQLYLQINGEDKDLTEVSHELLLFVEKLVLYLRQARASFENSPGNIGAAKAIEEWRRFRTPDNTEIEACYYGPTGHGVRRNGQQEPIGCQPFFDLLKLSAAEVGTLLEYAMAMESHIRGDNQKRENNGNPNGDSEKVGKSALEHLVGILSSFSLASQTPEHFYVSCVMKPNGSFEHAAGEESDSGRRRFKKKPTTLPFIYPRSPTNPNALCIVCTHEKCKRCRNGTSVAHVRHGEYLDGTACPPWEAFLNVRLLFPGLLMKDLVSQCRSVVLASGSLSPLQSVCAELDLQSEDTSKTGRLQTKPPPLEAKHVINLPKQLLAVAVGTFPDGSPLTVNYNNYKHPGFFPRLGLAIVNIIEAIPSGGCLVFFPSYSVLNKCVKCWKPDRFSNPDTPTSPEIWDRLVRSKVHVIVEPTGSQDAFEAARNDYDSTIKTHGSCVLLAVFRGKMSEGISFNDEYARVVICVGLPFPAAKDRAIVAKKAYNDEQRKLRQRTNLLPGNDWYLQECYRAVAQALGRCIRHEGDYGSVILLDSRHCHDGSPFFQHSKLPKWMNTHVRTLASQGRGFGKDPILGGYRGLKQEIEKFFAQAPSYTDGVLAKRNKEYQEALERQRQSSLGNLQSAPSSQAAAEKRKASQSVGYKYSEPNAKRITQDSPMPPTSASSFEAKIHVQSDVIDLAGD